MSDHTVYTCASHDAILKAIYELPEQVRIGNSLADTLLVRAGMVILAHIRTAFIAKSLGGTDESGERWAPLSPKTIAARIRKRDSIIRRPAANKDKSKARSVEWQRHYVRGLVMFKGNKAAAARRAWLVLGRPAHPYDKHGGQVKILNDSGQLLASLTPSSGSAYQVFKVQSGTLTLGTTRPGAGAHHRGVPGRLPQRRLWPEQSHWPQSWTRDLLDEIRNGLVKLAMTKVVEAR